MEREASTSALSQDTTSDAERILFEHYARLEPKDKVRIMCELGALMEQVSKRGIRERHPTAVSTK